MADGWIRRPFGSKALPQLIEHLRRITQREVATVSAVLHLRSDRGEARRRRISLRRHPVLRAVVNRQGVGPASVRRWPDALQADCGGWYGIESLV